jgi:acyl dehydratase
MERMPKTVDERGDGSMQGKYSEDLVVGERLVSHRRTITETDVVLFTSMTWIIDPIFTDEVFAVGTQFGSRSVPGPLVLAYALGLTEDLVYGTTLAALGIDKVRFLRPTRPGATIHVVSHVASCRESASRPGTSIAVFEHEVYSDGHDEIVCSFERQMLIGSRAFLKELATARGDEQ